MMLSGGGCSSQWVAGHGGSRGGSRSMGDGWVLVIDVEGGTGSMTGR